MNVPPGRFPRLRALDAFAATRALFAHRLGQKENAESLLQETCDRIYERACEPDFYGAWPWRAPEE